MASPIQAVTPNQAPQESQKATKEQNQQATKRSFESVLQNSQSETESQKTAEPEPAIKQSGARIEQLRLELMQKTDQIKSQAKSLDAMIPDLSDGRTRRGLLQEAMKGIKSPSLGGTDFKSVLGQLENQWLNVERIMTSDKTLTTGELLGLQARLYQVSQHVEVVSKVMDQVTGGIKTILNTNI